MSQPTMYRIFIKSDPALIQALSDASEHTLIRSEIKKDNGKTEIIVASKNGTGSWVIMSRDSSGRNLALRCVFESNEPGVQSNLGDETIFIYVP